MKREIKFRAWDKDRKVLVPEIEYYWGNFKKIGYLEVEGTHDGNAEQNQEVSTNFELMQFTGLKDKNGKEIYEGDIVKHHIFGINEVMWKAPAFWTKEVRQREAQEPKSTLGFPDEQYEIIGNVWENGDLLKN